MNGRFWVGAVLVVISGAPVVADVPQSMVGCWVMKGIGSLAGFEQTTEILEAFGASRAGGGDLSLTFPEPEGEPERILSSLACFPARIS